MQKTRICKPCWLSNRTKLWVTDELSAPSWWLGPRASVFDTFQGYQSTSSIVFDACSTSFDIKFWWEPGRIWSDLEIFITSKTMCLKKFEKTLSFITLGSCFSPEGHDFLVFWRRKSIFIFAMVKKLYFWLTLRRKSSFLIFIVFKSRLRLTDFERIDNWYPCFVRFHFGFIAVTRNPDCFLLKRTVR